MKPADFLIITGTDGNRALYLHLKHDADGRRWVQRIGMDGQPLKDHGPWKLPHDAEVIECRTMIDVNIALGRSINGLDRGPRVALAKRPHPNNRADGPEPGERLSSWSVYR
jgi:hypothetical protein